MKQAKKSPPLPKNGKSPLLADFRPAAINANKHTPRGMGMLDLSMSQDGFLSPITVAADGEAIDGSARLETAATRFDASPIIVESDGTRPVIHIRKDIPNAQTPQAKRLAVAANRVGAVDLEWDTDVLASLAADVDLSAFWFDDELKELLGTAPAGEDPGAEIDRAEELREKWQVESGQLWELGAHRLICGDCTERAMVERVMGGEKAQMVFTDPPYGVAYQGAGGDSIAGDVSYTAIPLFFASLEWVIDSKAFVYVCGGWTNIGLYSRMFERYFRLIPRVIVWDKGAMTMRHNGYHSAYEFIYFGYTKGAGSLWFGPRDGEAATDVWRVPKPSNDEREHLTEKPIELPERAIRNSCPEGGIVWEPFCGSGSTLIACERLGRKCRAIEISPAYCAVTLERWATMSGQTPRRAEG